MPDRCPECEALLPKGGACRDLFHELLVLEAQVPGTAGALTHFYTVACYALQHPDSFRYTQEALVGLHQALCDALDDQITLEELRRRARAGAARAGRVTRRPGDPTPVWRRGGWSMRVVDVLSVAPEQYPDTVRRWARSIRDSLAAKELSSR